MVSNQNEQNENEVLQQNLEEVSVKPGMVFIIHLLFDNKCEMPDREFMLETMKKHMGDVECFSYDKQSAGFAPGKYFAHFEKTDINPQLMVTECLEIEKPVMNELEMSQLWDCKDGKQILDDCKYQVIAMDMLAGAMDYKERADMLVEYIEALVEMFPECRAVVCENSKKMFSRDAILSCNMPKNQKFINYAVNVRFFNIQGTGDMLIDSVGMSTLWLPDVQYHFRGLDPHDVSVHAYNVLTYMFDNNCPIESGDHIDGLEDGEMSINVQWNVQYEDALIQPPRMVLDINTGEYAAGQRN